MMMMMGCAVEIGSGGGLGPAAGQPLIIIFPQSNQEKAETGPNEWRSESFFLPEVTVRYRLE
jgi:hypothetical protein